MGYKAMKKEGLYQIFRRWHSGQKVSEITIQEGRDRKTIQNYISLFESLGFKKDKSFPDRDLYPEGLPCIKQPSPYSGQLCKIPVAIKKT